MRSGVLYGNHINIVSDENMKYIILVIVEIILIALGSGKDLSNVSSWLLGINFTFAVFSINFAFFGYQLSRYKSILERVTKRQWFNIAVLLTLPFIPLIVFLVSQEYFALSALILLPIIVWSSIDNALLTKNYLDPLVHLGNELTDSKINKYLDELYKSIESEVVTHNKYLENIKTFQIPMHEWSFKTDLLGLKRNDLWDKVATVLKHSIENNDHPIYQSALDYAMKLLLATYRFESRKKNDYRERGGLQSLSQHRFRGLSYWVLKNDAEGIYVEAWANRLCAFLKSSEALIDPLGALTEGVMSDITYIGSIMLGSQKSHDPMKILNTIHTVIELSIHKIDSDEKGEADRSLDKYNVAGYAHLIKSLGKDAIHVRRTHFVYRCMETLSYLGGNSAKINSRPSVAACFDALVQLGRTCRREGIGCYWSRCIIPLHLHAEEFMGNILTWLVRDLKEDSSFTLKSCAEQAYSRLRGFKCDIVPKVNLNPKFWIEDIRDGDGNLVPHVESMSGMHGYGGEVDYSKQDDLTEYNLPDFN